jgi:hypothetical protein
MKPEMNRAGERAHNSADGEETLSAENGWFCILRRFKGFVLRLLNLAVNWNQLRENVAMRPSEVLPKHRETIRQLVLEAGMAKPRVFGSVLHGDDQDGSDLDLLPPGDLPPKFRDRVVAEAVSL